MPYFHVQPSLIPLIPGILKLSLFPFLLAPFLLCFLIWIILPDPHQPCNLGRMYILNCILQMNTCAVPQKTGLASEWCWIPRTLVSGPLWISHLFPVGSLICKTMWIPVLGFLTEGKRRKVRVAVSGTFDTAVRASSTFSDPSILKNEETLT